MQTLCWRVIDGRLHFAERADSLAALAPRAEIDPQALYDYLYFHVIPSPRTVFKGVHRLPPAHSLHFDRGQIVVQPYWLPRFEEPRRPDFASLAAEFRQRVQDAVAAQLDGSKPACFLSGGTDSSTVAGMLKTVAGHAATYSIGFEAEGYDEMAFARIAAKRFGTEHHEHYVTPDDLVKSIPAVAAHYDQPFGNSSVLPAYYCARMAREDGVTRLLAGDGGDEFFGGNSRYAKQRVFGWYAGVPGPLRAGLLEPLLQKTPLGGLPLARKGRSYVEQAQVPLPDRLQQYNLLLRLDPTRVFKAVSCRAWTPQTRCASNARSARPPRLLRRDGVDPDDDGAVAAGAAGHRTAQRLRALKPAHAASRRARRPQQSPRASALRCAPH